MVSESRAAALILSELKGQLGERFEVELSTSDKISADREEVITSGADLVIKDKLSKGPQYYLVELKVGAGKSDLPVHALRGPLSWRHHYPESDKRFVFLTDRHVGSLARKELAGGRVDLIESANVAGLVKKLKSMLVIRSKTSPFGAPEEPL